ncbi:MAG: alpha/beta fold hydrolase [Pseudomonadota bacterium]
MWRIVGLVAVFAMLAVEAWAGEVRENQAAPSPALGGEIRYSLYLPEGHETGARYPVVYLLHGYGGGQREWLHGGRLEALLDRLIAADEIGPVIAVMPAAGKSWYVDSARYGGPGDYETAIMRDLMAEIDRRYPTRAAFGQRAVAGNSMGGFGALRLAFRHPERFAAVAGLSPAIFMPDGVSWPDTLATSPTEEQDKWFPRTFGERFDLEIYKAETPFAHLDTMMAAQAQPQVLLTVADDDYFRLHDGTVEMYVELRRRGLKPELRVGDGGHDWDYWRGAAEEAFRFFDGVFHPAE